MKLAVDKDYFISAYNDFIDNVIMPDNYTTSLDTRKYKLYPNRIGSRTTSDTFKQIVDDTKCKDYYMDLGLVNQYCIYTIVC